MADRLGNRHSAGGEPLSVIRFGREEMNQHERPVEADVLPGEPVTLGADAEGKAVWAEYEDGYPVYVVKEARGRGMDINTDEGFKVEPASGANNDGPDLAPGLKASGGGLNVRVTAPADGGDETVEAGTAITADADDGFVVGDDNGVYALADPNEPVVIAEGETEIIPVEVA